MPEYLAPGVYVEETSFRAKSIEGVSTSTTAFVGPTRRGPVSGTPDLVTSFADFERIFGGAGRVHAMENYLAHGVQAYFSEGGARLYVSRVFTPLGPGTGLVGDGRWNDGRARSAALLSTGGESPREIRFVARFPGAAGNGRVTLRKVYQPASAEVLAHAEPGTLVRTGGAKVAQPARVSGSAGGPFSLTDGQTLKLKVGTQEPVVTFRGAPAVLTGGNAALDMSGFSPAERTLRVVVDGVEQTVTMDAKPYTIDELVDALSGLAGVAVSAQGDKKLVFTTTRRGAGATVQAIGGKFGFGTADGKTATTAADADNNVADLDAVTAAELDALLAGHGVHAAVREGRLELATEATGTDATLAVGEGTANGALGLTPHAEGEAARGQAGGTRGWYRQGPGGLVDADGASLSPGATVVREIVTVAVETQDADGQVGVYEGLHLGPEHPQFIGNVLPENPSRRSDWLEQAFAFTADPSFTAHQVHDALFGAGESATVALTGGNDGGLPAAPDYQAALNRLLPLEDISILAAPGHTALEGWDAIQRVLIAHVERPRAYQIAVLDSRHGQGIAGAREVRGQIDSKYAALYFPWVTVANPRWRPGRADLKREIDVPPSGFIAGVYARNDVQRGVHKAPANEVVRTALRFEEDINFDEQGVLNPIGVNCLRFFPGRGNRVWGARTVSSDPEWKYVNVRRYFNYVERSIDVGTQWAVFEPNGEALWANIRTTVSSFLYNEWRNGALLGGDPKEAYFVRCDRSTMTQNDLDNGRLVCLVGVAVIKPAEFVIFRIGQKTADARE